MVECSPHLANKNKQNEEKEKGTLGSLSERHDQERVAFFESLSDVIVREAPCSEGDIVIRKESKQSSGRDNQKLREEAGGDIISLNSGSASDKDAGSANDSSISVVEIYSAQKSQINMSCDSKKFERYAPELKDA